MFQAARPGSPPASSAGSAVSALLFVQPELSEASQERRVRDAEGLRGLRALAGAVVEDALHVGLLHSLRGGRFAVQLQIDGEERRVAAGRRLRARQHDVVRLELLRT